MMEIYWTCNPLSFVGETMIAICPDEILGYLIAWVVVIGIVLLVKWIYSNFRRGPRPCDLEGK